MASETIREFLVSLGFKVDDSTEQRFIGALEGATLRAKLLGDAIEAMASTVVAKVGEVGTQFEQLFYQSQRVGASAQSIKAFEYAVSQLAGSVEGANSSLESFGRFLRLTPGAMNWITTTLHVQTKDLNGQARDTASILLDIGEKLAHMPPYLAERYREMLGIDERTMLAIEKAPDVLRRYQESLKSQAGAGITGQAMQQATKFEQAWREVWQRIGNMAEGGETKLLTALTEPMQKFNQWLDQHAPEINDAIGKIANSVSQLTLAWVDDLDKVKWPDVAKNIDDSAKAIATFAANFGQMIAAIEGKLPLLEHLIAMYIGARTGAMFGPLGAGLGAATGWIGADLLETESNPETSTAGEVGGAWGKVKNWWRGHAPGWLGGGGVSYEDVPNAGNLTKLITAEAQRAGIDPRLMEGIRAGESGHGGRYDVNKNLATGDESYGPSQLNRLHPGDLGSVFERDTAAERKRLGFGGLEDPRTIPMQARFVAEYIKRTGSLSPWAGFHGARDADSRWGDSGYVPAPSSTAASKPPAPALKAPSIPLGWSTGPDWNVLNASLPVGPVSHDNSTKTVNAPVTNNITVNGPDPASAAAMGRRSSRSIGERRRADYAGCVSMIRRMAITILAVFIAAFRIVRRRRPPAPEVSARELIASRLAEISECTRAAGDPDGTRLRDAQAAWARAQERITAESVLKVVQDIRGDITHCGAAEARAVLDDLQREAAAHPEGVPGPIVASARLRFDEIMRANLQ
jgi:hypothetical protein